MVQLQDVVQIYTAGVAKATLRIENKPQRRRCGTYGGRSVAVEEFDYLQYVSTLKRKPRSKTDVAILLQFFR